MAISDFNDHEVRQMLQAIQGWLGTHQEAPSREEYAKLDADAAESLGSDFGLDKPSSHGLILDLEREGYLDAECHTTDSEVTPLRYVEVRGLTDRALGKLS